MKDSLYFVTSQFYSRIGHTFIWFVMFLFCFVWFSVELLRASYNSWGQELNQCWDKHYEQEKKPDTLHADYNVDGV